MSEHDSTTDDDRSTADGDAQGRTARVRAVETAMQRTTPTATYHIDLKLPPAVYEAAREGASGNPSASWLMDYVAWRFRFLVGGDEVARSKDYDPQAGEEGGETAGDGDLHQTIEVEVAVPEATLRKARTRAGPDASAERVGEYLLDHMSLTVRWINADTGEAIHVDEQS